MPTSYAYRVRDREGKMLGGTLEADSEEAVVTRLRQLGYSPISIEAEKSAGLKTELRLPGAGRVKLKDLALFSRQFATMINSGLSLLRALTILGEQTGNKRLAEIVTQVRAEVEKGMSLSAAMAKHPRAFNRLYISMVRAGEVGGFLDQVLVKVAETFEKEVELRGKIRSAMTYPVVVFVMVLLIVSAMLIFIVPTFKNLYTSLGGTLPLPTRTLIGVSDGIRRFFPLVVLALIGLVIAYRRWRATPAGRYRLDQFKLKVKVFGPLFHKSALSRFSRTLATLIRSGVPILQALEIVADTVNNGVISRAIRDVQDSVREGESLATPLAKHPTFPAMVVQMMAVGEETGALDTMLSKVADFYDQEVEAAVASLTSLIEPILIAVMGAAVGGMVVALYMPLFNIINLVK
ncbi:MAG TPA: type II secretion system F family protein [Actinomycetota bacterium]|jgi:type IV pilus assembly protein PilC|nr:type II secretion system F family protein [Actinomycetota bacterium]